MAISSINFAKSSGGSFAHNDRSEKEPDYLLPVEHRLENECDRSAPEAQKMLEDLFENAKENYSKTYGQKFQTKFENAHWEAVINLNKEHTIKDVERLVREIEKETGFTAVQISIHRDEGRLNEKTGHPIYNLHAHVNFSTLDKETGRQLYRRSISNSEREKIRKENGIPDGEKIPKYLTAVMDKAKLSKLQDITARELGMERGQKGSEKVRLGHKQYRASEQEKEKLLEKIDELQKENTELRYNFRETQKQITALEVTPEEKKELHRLNTEINKIKGESAEKDQKIEELKKSIETVRYLRSSDQTKILELSQTVDQLKKDLENIPKISQPAHEPINASKIANLQSENEMLQITNRVLEREVSELKENRAAPSIDVDQIEEVKKLKQITLTVPNGDERKALSAKLQKDNAIDEIERASYKKVEEKGLIYTTTKTVFDKDVFIQKVKEREKDHQKLHSINDKIVGAFVDKIKSIVEMTKTALETIKSKFTGKSLSEPKKELTELSRDITAPKKDDRSYTDRIAEPKTPEDKMREFVDKQKSPEKDLGLGR